MSKVVTCAAALTLMEKGLFLLDTPVSGILPEFAELRVLAGGGTYTVPATRPLLMRHLFCMTSGFGYNLTSAELRRVKDETQGACPTREAVRAMAKIPLNFEPGEKYLYGLSHDILAAAVEALSGERFGEYVKRVIFDPLGMTSSTFDPKMTGELEPQYRFNDRTGRPEETAKTNMYQPGILIDNRLEGSGSEQGSLMTGDPLPYHGDFACPEQIIPPRGLVDAKGKDVVWEACVTMNNHWGYCRTDGYFKPASMVIKKLVECVSKGGNLLLNVGPDARGRIPDESVKILKEVGRWMERNSESVYGCGKSTLPKPDYGRLTQRDGNTLYIHIFDNTVGPLPVIGVKQEDILSARDLATRTELRAKGGWMCSDYPDTAFITLGENPVLPDPDDTVIRLKLRKE